MRNAQIKQDGQPPQEWKPLTNKEPNPYEHPHMQEQKDAEVFQSKTFCLLLNDKGLKTQIIREGHMKNAPEEDRLQDLEILKGTDR